MTEAAQANLNGLECSFYTWQMRHHLYAASWTECQENPAAARVAFSTWMLQKNKL